MTEGKAGASRAQSGSAPGGPGSASGARKVFNPEPFGKYYLLHKIAVGGMAEVFLAKTFGHSGFQRQVVIKRILRHHADSREFVDMFIDEAKLSVQLTHPNIAQTYDFGKIGDDYFIAMEACSGQDLKGLMRRLAERNELMPPDLAALIAHEMANGLGYAHRKCDQMGMPLSVVHRDISPSNVLLTYEGHIKVIDFGIAKATSGTFKTEAGVLKGKFEYMSPEQTFGMGIDSRSDLFSTGICLWEMLTGRRLFKMASEVQTLEAIKNGEIPLPSGYNPEVPEELDRICMKALDRDKDCRYQDGAEMKRDLQDHLLPNTPDRIGQELGAFLRERFMEEIQLAQQSLDASTQAAEAMHYGGGGGLDMDLELDDEPPREVDTQRIQAITTGTMQAVPRGGAGRGFIFFVLAVMLGLVGAIGYIGYEFLSQRAQAPSAGLASISIAVLPPEAAVDAAFTLDGVPITASFDKVQPGMQHTLKVYAEGYAVKERHIELDADESFSMEITLTKAQPSSERLAAAAEAQREREKASSTPTPTPAAVKLPTATPAPATNAGGPAAVLFKSSPPGAKIYVDGRKLKGLTPYRWKNVAGGKTYKVELRLAGYETIQTVARTKPGKLATVNKTLTPAATQGGAPGKLSVQATPGWVKVYVDGAYVDTTPLFDYELPPGTYKIRLVNDRQGIDKTDTVTIKAGKVLRRAYQLDQ